MTKSAVEVPILESFRVIAADFDVALCDIWGVLHDGMACFDSAADALTRFRQSGGLVVLISNAPRPGAAVIPQLDQLGTPRSAWDAVVTSGDVTRAMLDAEPDRPYFWIGPLRDAPLFAGFRPSVATMDEARLVICTGLADDSTETPADYAAVLSRARALDLPFLCANPDLVVDRGGQRVYCAGALGDAYEKLGGAVIYAGKPDPPIYRMALGLVNEIRGVGTPLSRVIAIGDALRTDIAGAARLGCASLFIAHGIHAAELGIGNSPLTDLAMKRLLASGAPRPSFAMDRLAW